MPTVKAGNPICSDHKRIIIACHSQVYTCYLALFQLRNATAPQAAAATIADASRIVLASGGSEKKPVNRWSSGKRGEKVMAV